MIRTTTPVVILLILSGFLTGCHTTRKHESEQLSSTVLRASRLGVRCVSDSGRALKPLEVGSVVKSGERVETASVSQAYLVIGQKHENLRARGGLYDPMLFPYDLLLIYDNSAVEFNLRPNANGSQAGNEAPEVRLTLLSGAIQGNVKETPCNRTYEVAFPNGLAQMRDCIYRLDAEGNLMIFKGSADIFLNDKNKRTHTVIAWQKFEASSCNVAELDKPTGNEWTHNIWLPSEEFYVPWAAPPE